MNKRLYNDNQLIKNNVKVVTYTEGEIKMNKGMLRIDFKEIEKMLIEEKPELKDADLHISFAEVNNKEGCVEFLFTTDKPVNRITFEINDYNTHVDLLRLSH